jgi:hypothetical protein
LKGDVSVTPIAPDAALSAGAVSTDMLARLVPSVQMGHELDSATTFIRGIGPNTGGTGDESSVAVYLDDIYIPTGDASIFQLNAISGIDVLSLGFNQIPQFVAAGGHGYCPGEGGDDGNPQTSPIAFKCYGAPGVTYVGWYNTSGNEQDVSVVKHTTLELKVEQELGFAKGASITGWQNMTGFAQLIRMARLMAMWMSTWFRRIAISARNYR